MITPAVVTVFHGLSSPSCKHEPVYTCKTYYPGESCHRVFSCFLCNIVVRAIAEPAAYPYIGLCIQNNILLEGLRPVDLSASISIQMQLNIVLHTLSRMPQLYIWWLLYMHIYLLLYTIVAACVHCFELLHSTTAVHVLQLAIAAAMQSISQT